MKRLKLIDGWMSVSAGEGTNRMSAVFGMPVGRRYALLEKLGEGGMGEVYRAFDGLTRQTVALKRVRIPKDLSHADPEVLRSESDGLRLALAQEFHTLASLRHPHIISVLDYGFDEERQPYFTMDYLEDAKGLLAAAYAQPVETKVSLLVQVLQAVAYLHRRGIIHRDLKPANVLVTDGQVKVLDFGLSLMHDRADETEQNVVGTLAYMAPEVLAGDTAGQPADLYAVGIMAYELLVGRHPFNADNVGMLIHDIMYSSPDLSALYELNDLPSADPIFLPDDSTSELEITFPDSDRASPFDTDVFLPEESLALEPDDMDALAGSLTPTALPNIIARLLEKKPSQRYASAEVVIAQLEASVPFPLPKEGAAIRESYLQAARFVGRSAELHQLEAALEAAERGQGSAWLIAGESGVGKTRLLDELRIRALVRGCQMLRGQAVAEGGLPYQLWRDPVRRLILSTDLDDLDAGILKDLVSDIDLLQQREIPDVPVLEGVAYQQRLVGAIANLFQRQQQPTVLLLEDLQWSRESLDVLKQLCGMAQDLPLLILASYRDDERPDLPQMFPTAQRLKLGRLEAQHIASLSGSMLGEAGRQPQLISFLERETEGNVFFLVEVVRALAEEAGSLDRVSAAALPASVAAGGIDRFVQRRLSRVPEGDTELLWLAAVAGRELDLALLDCVKGDRHLETWLTTCSNCAVLEIQDGHWRFAHDKLRTGTLAIIPPDARPDLHRRMAEAIETVYGEAPEYAAILAQHWGSAQNLLKERQYRQRAGQHALHVSAFLDAINAFERALELLDKTTEPGAAAQTLQAELLLHLGEALKYTGEYDAASLHLEHALELRRNLNDPAGIALVSLELGDLRIYQGDYQEAKNLCEASLTLYRELKQEEGIAHALDRLGLVLFHQGDYAGAIALCEEGLSISRTTGDQKSIASAINNLGMAAFAQGDYLAAGRYFEETLTITQASGERRRAAAALLNLGSAAGEQQDYETANRHFEQSLTIFRSIGERRGVALALDNLGVIAEFQADYARATHYYEESLTLARSIGNRRGVATTLVNLGNVARARGENDRAMAYYQDGLRHAREIEAVPTLLEGLVGLAALQPDPLRALEWLGLVLNHPATYEGTRKVAAPVLERLKITLPADHIEAGLARGTSLDLHAAVADALVVNSLQTK